MKKLISPLLTTVFLSVSMCLGADKMWIGFDDGLALAKKSQKPMIVDFYTDWCHWCKVMDEKTFSQQDVKAKLEKNFVTVRINAEDPKATATYKGHTFNNIELTRAFGVTGYPTLAFLEEDGDIITTIPGYIPAEQFIHILAYIEQKRYEQKMPFEEFLKLQEENKS